MDCVNKGRIDCEHDFVSAQSRISNIQIYTHHKDHCEGTTNICYFISICHFSLNFTFWKKPKYIPHNYITVRLKHKISSTYITRRVQQIFVILLFKTTKYIFHKDHCKGTANMYVFTVWNSKYPHWGYTRSNCVPDIKYTHHSTCIFFSFNHWLLYYFDSLCVPQGRKVKSIWLFLSGKKLKNINKLQKEFVLL